VAPPSVPTSPDTGASASGPGAKAAYQSPRLSRLGRLEELTLGATGSGAESQNAGSNPT